MASPDTHLEKSEIDIEHQDDIRAGVGSPHAQVPIVLHKKDVVAQEAIGGAYEELPHGYYWSKDFLGTLTVLCFTEPIPSQIF